MNKETSRQLLQNPEQEPTDALLKALLDTSTYEILQQINQRFKEQGVDFEWRYYKDGKVWLGKAAYRKKTRVWISVWEGFIKASFYFTEKNRQEVLGLPCREAVISSFATTQPIGKLIPLTLDIKDNASLQDFTILLSFKMNLP